MQEGLTLHFPCPSDPCDAAAAPISTLNSGGTRNSCCGVDPLSKPWWKPSETGEEEDDGHKQTY